VLERREGSTGLRALEAQNRVTPGLSTKGIVTLGPGQSAVPPPRCVQHNLETRSRRGSGHSIEPRPDARARRRKVDGMPEIARFLQGAFDFEGKGLDSPVPFKPRLVYSVPHDQRARLLYLRSGNSSDEMIYVLLSKNGRRMRYFPIGAKGAIHVTLAIVEMIPAETELELLVGAPEGLAGTLVIDMGLSES
jgi:hypothetical protein